MGQQQLLLIVLGMVVVGVAVVIGIQYFDQRMRENDKDVLTERCVTIATRAITWKMAGDPFNNPRPKYSDLLDEGLKKLYAAPTGFEGTVALSAATETSLEIIGVSARYPNTGVRVVVEGYNIVFSEHSYDGEIRLPAGSDNVETFDL